MAKFTYLALNSENELIKSEDNELTGFVTATDKPGVNLILIQKNLRAVIITEVDQKKSLDLSKIFYMKRWVSLGELEMFFRATSILLAAGIPLVETFALLSNEMDNYWFQKRLKEMNKMLQDGATFHMITLAYPKIFDPLMQATIEAGETTGALDKTLYELSDICGRQNKLRRELINAMIYPISIMICFFGLITGMLIVLPRIMVAFVGKKKIVAVKPLLPRAIRLCFWVNDHPQIWLLPLILIIIGVILHKLSKKNFRLRLFFARIGNRIPVIGKILLYFTIVRMLYIFCLLEKAGVEPLKSLRVISDCSGHPMIEEAMVRVIGRVRTGIPRHAALALEPVFPSLLVEMWHAGEKAGNIIEIMSHISEYYYDRAKAYTDRLVTAIEPITIVSIGAAVGPFIIGMYLALQVISDQMAKG